MAGDNAKQIEDWNGSVGEHWAAEQENTDRLIAAFGEAALRAAAAQAGERVLDVGCGCGYTMSIFQAICCQCSVSLKRFNSRFRRIPTQVRSAAGNPVGRCIP